MGARFVEHWARLVAAERGGETEPFLHRCEALPPASA